MSMPVTCPVCGSVRDFTEGALDVVSDDGVTIIRIGACHIKAFLEQVLDHGWEPGIYGLIEKTRRATGN